MANQNATETARDALRPLVIVSCLFIVLDTIFVVLRFVSRNVIKKVEFGWEYVMIYHLENAGFYSSPTHVGITVASLANFCCSDFLIIPSWVCNIGLCVTGLGKTHLIACFI